MRIEESKNLKYTKQPFYYYYEGSEKAIPEKCLLSSFHDIDDNLELHFKNGTVAFINALNPEGGRELDVVEGKLGEFMGKHYGEILSADF